MVSLSHPWEMGAHSAITARPETKATIIAEMARRINLCDGKEGMRERAIANVEKNAIAVVMAERANAHPTDDPMRKAINTAGAAAR